MPISISDIKFLYSGGVANTNANLSLGGIPSGTVITNNTLFDNVTAVQSSSGMTDYRCIYVSNTNPTYSFYNVQIFPTYTVTGNVYVQLGFSTQNDRQNVYITNFANISGGSLTLTYTNATSTNFTFSYDSDPSVFATNFQNSIRAIGGLEDVTVSAVLSQNTLAFEINFVGTSSSRFQNLLVIFTNNLTYSGSQPIASSVKAVDGGPVNQETVEIDNELTNPNGIIFYTTTYTVTELKPLDVVPVWIKRVVPVNTAALENDGFVLNVRGNTVLI